MVRAKAEVEERGGGEEVRRAGLTNNKQQQLTNNKGHRGKVRQNNMFLPVFVSVLVPVFEHVFVYGSPRQGETS